MSRADQRFFPEPLPPVVLAGPMSGAAGAAGFFGCLGFLCSRLLRCWPFGIRVLPARQAMAHRRATIRTDFATVPRRTAPVGPARRRTRNRLCFAGSQTQRPSQRIQLGQTQLRIRETPAGPRQEAEEGREEAAQSGPSGRAAAGRACRAAKPRELGNLRRPPRRVCTEPNARRATASAPAAHAARPDRHETRRIAASVHHPQSSGIARERGI